MLIDSSLRWRQLYLEGAEVAQGILIVLEMYLEDENTFSSSLHLGGIVCHDSSSSKMRALWRRQLFIEHASWGKLQCSAVEGRNFHEWESDSPRTSCSARQLLPLQHTSHRIAPRLVSFHPIVSPWPGASRSSALSWVDGASRGCI